MGASTLIGWIAVLLTTASWIPQIRRAVTSRSAVDFSWSYLLLFGVGVSSWLIYGILKRDAAIIVANTMAVGAMCTLMWIRFYTAAHRVERPT